MGSGFNEAIGSDHHGVTLVLVVVAAIDQTHECWVHGMGLFHQARLGPKCG